MLLYFVPKCPLSGEEVTIGRTDTQRGQARRSFRAHDRDPRPDHRLREGGRRVPVPAGLAGGPADRLPGRGSSVRAVGHRSARGGPPPRSPESVALRRVRPRHAPRGSSTSWSL